MRAATKVRQAVLARLEISIHAAHAGSDVIGVVDDDGEVHISIHAAHAGSDD